MFDASVGQAWSDPVLVFAQALGLLGFGVGVMALLSREDGRLKLLISLVGLIMAAHFALLGALTGAAANVLTALRAYLSRFAWAKPAAPVFIAAYLGFGAWTYRVPADLLAIGAGVSGTVAMFYCAGERLRLVLLLTTSLWFAHNLTKGSIGGVLMEAVFAGSLLLAMMRERRQVATDP